ncbi:MAG: hypothetical protein LBI05_09830 [Planctomycetaceae bacterium]|jgi:hypothetical protein|nr:hypothetical protein [Planctomycetaceae bacterium]
MRSQNCRSLSGIAGNLIRDTARCLSIAPRPISSVIVTTAVVDILLVVIAGWLGFRIYYFQNYKHAIHRSLFSMTECVEECPHYYGKDGDVGSACSSASNRA